MQNYFDSALSIPITHHPIFATAATPDATAVSETAPWWNALYLHLRVLDNSLLDWLIGATIASVVYFLLLIARRIVRKLIARAATTENKFDDLAAELAGGTKQIFLLLVAIFIGSLWLRLPGDVTYVMRATAVIALLLQMGMWGQRIIQFFVQRQREREAEVERKSTFSALGYIGRVVLWGAVFLLVLDNLGVSITALIATLGVGGIAVALATQNILGDLFASIVIMLDKPFIVGDFIIVGDLMGVVEQVGLKTTRVKSLTGEQIVFSNADLLNSRVRNFRRMQERRVTFTLGVTYQTKHEHLVEIPGLVREIIAKHDLARADRCHFKSYGDYALIFEFVYFVKSRDMTQYMDMQQQINLDIFAAFAERGIQFAYPTQTVFVHQIDGVNA